MPVLLIFILSEIFSVAPRNVVDRILLKKNTQSEQITIKLRRKTVPKINTWWTGDELRVRIAYSRFSQDLNFKRLAEKGSVLKVSGHYEDSVGSVLKLKFNLESGDQKPDLKISRSKGFVFLEVQKPGIVKSEVVSTEKTDVKKVLNTVPAVSGDKILNENPEKPDKSEKKIVSVPENNKNKGNFFKNSVKNTKKNNMLGESVKKQLKSSSGKTTTSGGGGWFNTLLVLLFLGFLGGGAYYIIKKQNPGNFKDSDQIEVLARKQLTREHKIVVVKFGGRVLVLGLTSGSVSVLTEFIPSMMENDMPEEIPPEDDDFSDKSGLKSESKKAPESVEGILKLKEKKDLDKNFKVSPIEDATSQAAFLKELKKHL